MEKIIMAESNAKNVDWTTCDRRKNWKQFYMDVSGRNFATCSFKGCSNPADVGGHLHVKELSRNYHYIAPICSSCNQQTDYYYIEMKKNTAYVKIPINSCVNNY